MKSAGIIVAEVSRISFSGQARRIFLTRRYSQSGSPWALHRHVLTGERMLRRKFIITLFGGAAATWPLVVGSPRMTLIFVPRVSS
jgi:hypothetical protein